MKELLLIALIHLLAVMSPGPDLIMIAKNSVVYSRKTGVYTAIGLALGILTHVTYTLIGIGIIISQSIILYSVIKIAGAFYLIYLGLKALLSKSSMVSNKSLVKAEKDMSKFQAVKIGYLTNILNPKVTIFFLSIFSQVVSPETGLGMKILYGAEMSMATFVWFSFVANVLTIQAIKQHYDRFSGHIEKTMGVILTALGLKIIFSGRD
ncbi:LysE family transporter [Patescibacteria group bacterium]|nr:LysE family transporter [Patescibacteria group bacterium]MBU1683063.1 LysE family transporter [Patescibacteria group bacterium]